MLHTSVYLFHHNYITLGARCFMIKFKAQFRNLYMVIVPRVLTTYFIVLLKK